MIRITNEKLTASCTNLKGITEISRANRATCERLVAKWQIIDGKDSAFAMHCPASGRRQNNDPL